MYFILKLSLPNKNFQPILFMLFKVQLSSEYVLKQKLTTNMPKSTSFLLKNRKNRPALGALPPDPYASGSWGLHTQTRALALSRYEFFCSALNYNWHFHMT